MDFIDKLMEINSIILAFFGIGIFGALKSLTKVVINQQSKKQLEKELLNESISLLKNANLAILHNKIYTQCGEFLETGFIAVDDLDDLNYLFNAYKSLGGNGTGEALYKKVAELPNKKGKK